MTIGWQKSEEWIRFYSAFVTKFRCLELFATNAAEGFGGNSQIIGYVIKRDLLHYFGIFVKQLVVTLTGRKRLQIDAVLCDLHESLLDQYAPQLFELRYLLVRPVKVIV